MRRHHGLRAAAAGGNLAGRTVAVAGLGGLGHLAIRMADAMGARVVAIMRGEGKADLARRLGAPETIGSAKEKVGKRLAEMGGADLVLVTAISARAFGRCIPGLAPNGTLVALAAMAGQAKLVPADLLTGQKRIAGSLIGTGDDMDAMRRFAADHRISPMVERRAPGRGRQGAGPAEAGGVRVRAVPVP